MYWNTFRTSSSRCEESPRDDEVVIVVPTDREDTPPRLVTDSSGILTMLLTYGKSDKILLFTHSPHKHYNEISSI